MGHVRIVAGVFHHGGLRGAVHQPRFGQGEAGTAAPGQGDAHRVGEDAGLQRSKGSFGGRGGAGPRGPAAAQVDAVCHRRLVA